jgi:hypothetical protein
LALKLTNAILSLVVLAGSAQAQWLQQHQIDMAAPHIEDRLPMSGNCVTADSNGLLTTSAPCGDGCDMKFESIQACTERLDYETKISPASKQVVTEEMQFHWMNADNTIADDGITVNGGPWLTVQPTLPSFEVMGNSGNRIVQCLVDPNDSTKLKDCQLGDGVTLDQAMSAIDQFSRDENTQWSAAMQQEEKRSDALYNVAIRENKALKRCAAGLADAARRTEKLQQGLENIGKP